MRRYIFGIKFVGGRFEVSELASDCTDRKWFTAQVNGMLASKHGVDMVAEWIAAEMQYRTLDLDTLLLTPIYDRLSDRHPGWSQSDLLAGVHYDAKSVYGSFTLLAGKALVEALAWSMCCEDRVELSPGVDSPIQKEVENGIGI